MLLLIIRTGSYGILKRKQKKTHQNLMEKPLNSSWNGKDNSSE
jgi:hypothetical protein